MGRGTHDTHDQPLDLFSTALTFLTPVFGVAYSWFLLNETLTPIQLLGVLGVCLGVYIVNSGGAPRPQVIMEEETLSAAREA